MTNEEIVVSVIVLGLVWFWLVAIRIKELATESAKRLCERAQVMILDDSVALTGLSLARNQHGRVGFRRTYRFEFASDGNQRYQGKVIMLGSELVATDMDAYRIVEE